MNNNNTFKIIGFIALVCTFIAFYLATNVVSKSQVEAFTGLSIFLALATGVIFYIGYSKSIYELKNQK